jgi:hypothetical protein
MIDQSAQSRSFRPPTLVRLASARCEFGPEFNRGCLRVASLQKPASGVGKQRHSNGRARLLYRGRFQRLQVVTAAARTILHLRTSAVGRTSVRKPDAWVALRGTRNAKFGESHIESRTGDTETLGRLGQVTAASFYLGYHCLLCRFQRRIGLDDRGRKRNRYTPGVRPFPDGPVAWVV